MDARFDYGTAAPGVYAAMDALEQYLDGCGLEPRLLHLVKLRASQVNGCAYCLDMHWKDLRALGENEQRLYSLDAWRECPYYTDRERAALAWTEAVTWSRRGTCRMRCTTNADRTSTTGSCPNLTLLVATINAWNRLSIRRAPGAWWSRVHARNRAMIMRCAPTAAARRARCATAEGQSATPPCRAPARSARTRSLR